MNLKHGISVLFGAAILFACSDENSPTGPDVKPKDNPFVGRWSYVKYIAYENGGEDTVDYTADYSMRAVIFYDSTGRYQQPARPNSPLDSLKYYFNPDSLFVAGHSSNFLNFAGRPYEFRGESKDTLDLSDSLHIEILTRSE